jgi:hypothetical protein
MFEKFTADARRVIEAAQDKALAHGDQQIGAAHLLYALTVTDGAASRALAGLGIGAAAAERALDGLGDDAPGLAADPGGVPARQDRGDRDDPGDPGDPDAEALKAIGIDLEEIRRKAEESFGPGALDRVRAGSAPRAAARRAGRLSPLDRDVRQALAMSLTAARALHSGHIGTEHLLLGLVGAGERSGSAVPGLLRDLHLDASRVRERVVAEVGAGG